MKPFIIILASFLLVPPGFAQNNDPFVYTDIGIGKGNFASYKMGLNWFFLEHHNVGIYYHRHWRDGLQVPDDYSSSGIFGNSNPNDKLIFGSATYGRVIPMTDIARINVKGGLVAGVNRYLTQFQRNNGNGWLVLSTSNYTYTTDQELMLGVIINPVAEFMFSSSVGMTLGVSGMYSGVQSFFSIDLTLIAGSLRAPASDANYE